LKEDLDKKDQDDKYIEAQMPPRDTGLPQPEAEFESVLEGQERVPGLASAGGSDESEQDQAEYGEVQPTLKSG